MTSALKIGVGGALGRMGSAVTAMVRARDGVVLAGRFDRPDAPQDPVETVPLATREVVLKTCDVVVDCSTARGGVALVVGATGLTAEEQVAVARASKLIAIVQSGNYSVGVNVLAGLVEQASRRLGPDVWDIEIVEAHHRRKVDAPSGTAGLLAQAAARGRGRNSQDIIARPRDGITGPRSAGEIGMASLRGGGIVGDHSVVFAAEEEIITLSHSARDRALFARGALEAAVWVAGRPPGLYDMVDVLGFRDGA